jgi:hypothetical protein
MAPRTPPPTDSPDETPEAPAEAPEVQVDAPVDAPVDEPLPLVTARYVGIEPVLAVIAGVQVIVEPGDPITVTSEQLEQNPVFEVWED